MSAIRDTDTDIATATDMGVMEITLEEAWADFAFKTRLYMHMEPDEFFRRLDAGEYNDELDEPESAVPFLARMGSSLRGV